MISRTPCARKPQTADRTTDLDNGVRGELDSLADLLSHMDRNAEAQDIQTEAGLRIRRERCFS
jgi:hypothetical protein